MWNVTAHNENKLLVIKTDNVFDYGSLRDLLTRIYIHDNGAYASYNRYADLSAIETIEVDLDTVVESVKGYRRFKRQPNDVKIAVLLRNRTVRPLAYIYMLLTETKMVNINIFSSVEECAGYLQVDQSLLTECNSSIPPFLTTQDRQICRDCC